MSGANRNVHGVEPLQISGILAVANEQLRIERACLLIDNYIAEMAQQEARVALAEIKAALRARLPST